HQDCRRDGHKELLKGDQIGQPTWTLRARPGSHHPGRDRTIATSHFPSRLLTCHPQVPAGDASAPIRVVVVDARRLARIAATAIRVALRNETVAPRRMLGEILRQAADYVPDPDSARVALTPTEMHVLRLMAQGLATKQIAIQMGTARASVETHIRNIYRKLDANNRAAAIGFALKLRLLKVSDL